MPLFWKAMRNTFYYTLASVGLSVVIGLLLALALYQGIKGTLLSQRLLPAGRRVDGGGVTRLGTPAGTQLRAGEFPARSSWH